MPLFGQEHVFFENIGTIVPSGKIQSVLSDGQPFLLTAKNAVKAASEGSVKYKPGKQENYAKAGEDDEWNLTLTTFYNYNDSGNLTKQWDENDSFTPDNNYSLYFYDERNRNNRIEYYFDDGANGLSMNGYHQIDYLADFPDMERSRIYYTREAEWDNKIGDWKYAWKISGGEKRDYTISKKVTDHYEKKVDYTYNPDNEQWEVSGYKYDYVLNPKGYIIEELVYQATNESEDEWPLVLHVKNLVNDNGIVFRSDRINYRSATSYIERWSSIQWESHDGTMPVSGYAVQGSNRMKSAKIEYLLFSNPNTEYAPSRSFSSDYQNPDSFHYIIRDNSGNTLIDNSYYVDADNSLQEIWQGRNYQMRYIEFDEHNCITYDHYVQKQFYDYDNVITQRDWHRYTYNEYYLNSNELTLQEHYEYDALADAEPYGRSRTVYSDFKEYSAKLGSVMQDNQDQVPVYYNFQGISVRNPMPGQLLIRKAGSRTEKVIY